MIRQDFIIKQINQLGQVLARLLSDLQGLKSSGQKSAGLEITNQTLKNELDLDVQELIDIPTDNFIETLTDQKNITIESLEKLAEILLLIADNNHEDSKIMYQKCVIIYEYLEKAEDSYTLHRQWILQRIKKEL